MEIYGKIFQNAENAITIAFILFMHKCILSSLFRIMSNYVGICNKKYYSVKAFSTNETRADHRRPARTFIVFSGCYLPFIAVVIL